MYSHWAAGTRKGRMNLGQSLNTLDPAITKSVLMNTYSAANHDLNSIGSGRNGKISSFCVFFFFANNQNSFGR